MMNLTIKDIENQLNKIFGSLNSCYSTKVSFILFHLDLSMFNNKNYRFTFKFDSMLKLYLLKRLKRITLYPKLIKYLQENKKEALDIGFLQDENYNLILPKKRTFNHYINKKFNNSIKEILDHIYRKILSFNKKLDIKEIKKNKKKCKRDYRKELKEATKLVKKLVYPEVKIKINHNAKFNTGDLLDILVHVAQTHDFCNNGVKTFSELNPNLKVPHGDTIMYHFHKLKNTNEIKIMFERIFDVIFSFAKRNYNLLNRRQLDLAVDIHKVPYYGDKNDDYVVESKHERGTTHFYKFLTCAIVVSGRRFTIDAVPIHALDNLEDLLDQMIKRAKSKINIRFAYLDREFDKPKFINLLKRNKIKFIMPKIRNPIVKQWFDKSETCEARIIKDFEIGKGENKAVCNLILVNDEDGIKRAFITNFNIPVQLTHYLYFLYSKRWGIETSYRNLEHDFKARTTSKSFHIILFYFLFSVCLYNLWVLVNICVSLMIYGRLLEKPLITAKLFAVILYRVSCDDFT